MGTSGGFLLAVAFTFLANILLSNILDVHAYGSIVLVLTWAGILGQFIQLGLNRVGTKVIAQGLDKNERSIVGTFSLFSILVVTVVFLLTSPLILYFLSHVLTKNSAFSYIAMCTTLLVFPLAISRVGAGILLGCNHGFFGAFAQNGIFYFIITLCVGFLFIFWDESAVVHAPIWILCSGYISCLLVLVLVFLCNRFSLNADRSLLQITLWFKMGVTVVMIGGVQILNRQIGTVVIGGISGTEAVAEYYPALRISEFAAFGLIAVNAAIASSLAAVSQSKNSKKLQSVLTKGAILATAITGILVFALWVLGDILLGLFGSISESSVVALKVLLAGSFLNSCAGSVSIFFMMSGQERVAAKMAFLTLVLNFGLHVVLVKGFGIVGAAVASSISLGVWNILLVSFALRYMKIDPTIFSLRLRGKV